MARRDPRVHVDSDGVRSVESRRSRLVVWLASAALIALALVFLALRPQKEPPATEIAASEPNAAAPPVAAPPRAQPPRFKPVRRPDRPADAPPVDAPPQAESVPDAAAEPVDEPAAGEEGDDKQPTGIALFPPPGTDPPKSGLIVPDDFPLPPGYVRHYQATDDGRRLPAILMFHPDYEWVDENGEPIELPEDGIVPPELAPEGLPLQTLEVPETAIPIVEEPGPGDTATD